jgi:hypothetical protein
MALSATPASAGSSHVAFSFFALPPALTLSDGTTSRFGLLKGVFTTFNTSATHVLLTVTVTASQAITVVSSGCTTSTTNPNASPITTTIACARASLNPNSTDIIPIEFQSPSTLQTCAAFSTPCITFNASLAFTEGNTAQGDAVQVGSSTVLLFSSTNQVAADGNCVTAAATLGTVATLTAPQATQVSFAPGNNPLCTPGAAGVAPPTQLQTPLRTNVSFVALPTLPQLATVQVTFFSLPSGSNANNFVLQELVNYGFGSTTSPTGFFAVPACQNGTIPPTPNPPPFPGVTYDSCVSAQSKYGRGGVIITLLVRPSGDPGFSG